MGGERYAIYNEGVDPVRPLSALKLKNTSSLHLQQGPITVFDGGSYAGDAQIADLPAGSEVFISYAVDLETEVEAAAGSGTEDISTVRISRGTVITTWRQVRERAYTVKNRGQRAKTIIIEHPISSGFNLVEPKQPMETARGLYRFSLPVDKGKSVKLSVVEDRMVEQSVAFTNLPSDRIDLYLRAKNVSQAIKDALQKLVGLKAKLAEASVARARLEEQVRAIYADQDRIRSNMAKLSKSSDLYKKYEKTLSGPGDHPVQAGRRPREGEDRGGGAEEGRRRLRPVRRREMNRGAGRGRAARPPGSRRADARPRLPEVAGTPVDLRLPRGDRATGRATVRSCRCASSSGNGCSPSATCSRPTRS